MAEAMLFDIGDEFEAVPEWLLADGVTRGRIDGLPEWNNPTPLVYEMTVSADGLTARGKIIGRGPFQISASGDADLLPGEDHKRAVVIVGEGLVPEEEVTMGRMTLTKLAPPA